MSEHQARKHPVGTRVVHDTTLEPRGHGVVIHHGREGATIYTEVRFDGGVTERVHRTSLRVETWEERPCAHCGHRRDAHEIILGSECRECSCVEFLEADDEEPSPASGVPSSPAPETGDKPMKIRVVKAPPVEAKHGIREGRVFEVLRPSETRARAVVVRGDAGEEVTLLDREYAVIEVTA